jgi:hypothetical protein
LIEYLLTKYISLLFQSKRDRICQLAQAGQLGQEEVPSIALAGNLTVRAIWETVVLRVVWDLYSRDEIIFP